MVPPLKAPNTADFESDICEALNRGDMMRFVIIAAFLSASLSGCVAPELSIEDIDTEDDSPARISFEASTYYGSNNSSSTADLQDISNGKDVLVLWVGATCRGCHDWTDMIHSGIANGTIEEGRVITIHRYAAFESEEEVVSTYVSDESEHPSTWPVMLPNEDAGVKNLDTGQTSSQSIYEAFNQPSTPTLQIYRSDGSVDSLDHSYWADWDELVSFEGALG